MRLVNSQASRAELSIHAGVFPLDRQRAVIANVVQSSNDLFEVDRTTARRSEIPTATVIPEIDVACQNTTPSIERGNGIFDVNVVDPVWKCSDKLDGSTRRSNDWGRN